jgi:hypothetical protein
MASLLKKTLTKKDKGSTETRVTTTPPTTTTIRNDDVNHVISIHRYRDTVGNQFIIQSTQKVVPQEIGEESW